MNFTEQSLRKFTEQLASKTPVPGGGGAAAYAGALAAALADMVGEFTVGKKKYAKVEPEIRLAMQKAQELREQLLACIEKDAAAFEPLSKAYAIPKDDPDRDTVMEACLQLAAAVPMEILDLSAQVIQLADEFAKKGSIMMLSDAACAAAIGLAALKSAAVNVKINTKSMKDRTCAKELDEKTDCMLKEFSSLADLVFESVYAKY